MDKVVGPVAQATKSGKTSKRLAPKRRNGIFLLEPRVMYDGAAAPTAAAATHHHDHAHNPDDPQGGPVDHSFHGFTPHGNSQGAASSGSEPTANFSAPTTVTPGAEPNAHAPGGNVVFVDSQIADYQAIVSAINPGTTVFVFDGTKDGLQQIAQDLQGMHGLHSVDIISHGAADEVLVGTDTLTTSTIPTYAADLTAIGKALAPHGQLDLYGCDVAAAGDGFLTALQQATGRNVAASTGPIGATALGGTWTLNATTGPTPDALPVNLAALQSFDGLLVDQTGATGTPVPVVDPGPDSSVTVTTNTDNFAAVFGVAELTGGQSVLVGLSTTANDYTSDTGAPTDTGLQVAIVNNGIVSSFDVPMPSGTSASADYIGGAAVTALTNGNFAVLYWGDNASDGTNVPASGTNGNLPGYYVQIFSPTGTAVGSLITIAQNSPYGTGNEAGTIAEDKANNGFVIGYSTGDVTTDVIQRFSNSGTAGDSFDISFGGASGGPPTNIAVDGDGNLFVQYQDGSNNNVYAYIPDSATSITSTGVLTEQTLPGSNNGGPDNGGFVGLSSGGFVGFFFDGTNLAAERTNTSGVLGTEITLGDVDSSSDITDSDYIWSAVALSDGDFAVTLQPISSSGSYHVAGTNQVIEVGPALTAADTTIYDLTTSSGSAAEFGPFAVADQNGGLVSYTDVASTFSTVGYPLNASVTAVTYLDPRPTVTAGATVTFYGGGSALTLDPGLTIAPGASTTLDSATVTLTSGELSSDILSFNDGTNTETFSDGDHITASYSGSVLTLSGTATVTDYQTALDQVQFSTTSNADPTNGGSDTSRTISWQVTDTASHNSVAVTSTLDVVHEPPVVTAGAIATFYGGGSALPLDSSITLSDADSGGDLTRATVSIGTGFVTGDVLGFTAETGITGSYNTVDGVLTLSGTATIAQYQTALESVTYSFSPTNADPTSGGSDTSRTISWVVSDGTSSSATATSTLDTVHVAPTVTAGASVTFVSGGSAAVLDSGVSVADVDSGGDLTGATVKIASLVAGDTLDFTNQTDITGTYNSGNGTLTLTGTATLAQYQAALESIKFGTTSTSAGSRTIDWSVTDAASSSSLVTSTVAIDVAPTVTASGTQSYVGGGSAVQLDPGITLSDSLGSLSGATVTIGGFITGDTLNFSNQNGISGVYSNGVLTLTGTATSAQYKAALASITYSDGDNDPTGGGSHTSRTISWQVIDTESLTSSISTSSLSTQHVAPTVTAGATATFIGGGSPVPLDGTLTVSDNNSGGNLIGASVQIGTGFISGDTLTINGLTSGTINNGANGTISYAFSGSTLTLSGTDTRADYQAALQLVTYSFAGNGDPTGGGGNTQRSIYWVVNDGNTVNGTNETFPSVQAINNDQPSLGLNQYVVEDGLFPSQDGGVDGGGIPLGSIRTFAGFDSGAQLANGQDLAINANTALFSILGTMYGGNGTSNFGLPNLGGALAVGFGGSLNPYVGDSFGTDQITLTGQNLPPGAGGTGLPFENDQPSLTVNYIINVGGAFSGNSTDVLGEVVPFLGNFAPTGYAFANGQLLSIQQNTALFSLLGTTYGGNGTTNFALPDLNGKTIVGAGSDSFQTVLPGTTTGQDSTTIANSNLPFPVGGGLPVSNDQPSVALTYLVATQGLFPSGASLSPDTPYLGEVIAYAGTGGGLTNMLADGWAVANGQTLSIAQNSALFEVLGTNYGGNGQTTFNLPDLVGRSIAGVGTNADGTTVTLGEAYGTDSFTLKSNNLPLPGVATSTLLVHEPPTVTAGATTTFHGGGSPVTLDGGLSVADVDSGGDLTGATVTIGTGFVTGDVLGVTAETGITASYNSGTGVLTLSGTAALGTYQAELDSITFSTTANTDGTRTIDWSVKDAASSSSQVTSTVTVEAGPHITSLVGQPVNGGTVELKGTAITQGDTIDLYADGNMTTIVGTGTVVAGGTFDITTTADFTDGKHTFTAIETNSSNPTIPTSQPFAVEVESLPPTDLAQKGTATNGGTIEITGTGDASGDTITLYNGATVIGTGTAGINGAFDITATGPFPDGTYTNITATDTSADGTQTSAHSSAATAIVESVAPTGLAQKGTAINGGTIEITGTGDASGDTITLYNGATVIGTGTAGANGAFDITAVGPFPDGTYSNITATDTSADGTLTSGHSSAATAIVESVAPTGLVQKGTAINGGTIEITGTGDASGDTITLYNGATVIGTGTAGVNGAFDIVTTADFADGTYSNITATDTSVDGTQTSGHSSAATATVESVAPTGLALVGTPTGGGTIEITGTGDASGDTITLYNGATVIGTGTAGANGAFDITAAGPFPDGTYSVTATDTSSDGTLTSGHSSALTVNVDPIAPVITALVGQPVNGGTVELQGTGEIGETITLYADGNMKTIVGTGTVGAGGTFDIITAATFPDGVHTFTATETDAANLTSTASTPAFTVDVDPTAPVITAVVGQPVSGGTVELQGTGEVGEAINLYADGTSTIVGTGTVGAGGTFDITTTATFLDRVHSFTAKQTDAANLTSTASTPAFTVDVDPNAPVITAQVGQPVDSGTIELQGTGEVGDTVNLYADGNTTTIVGTGMVTAGGTFDITTTATFADGVHTFMAKQTDAANLTSTASTPAFSVDVVPTLSASGTVTYVQNGSSIQLDATATADLGEPGGPLTGATVSIGSGFFAGDVLTFTNQNGITGSYDAVHGVLTLTGSASVANYNAALDSITFSSTSSNPSNDGADSTRTIVWSVKNGNPSNAVSATVTSTVDVEAVPTVVAGADVSLQALGTNSVVLDPAINAFDDTPLTGATVTIAGGLQSSDVLAANTANTAITASYANGVLTLTGTDTAQHYQTVLASVTLTSSQTQSGPATIDWQITDQKGRTSAVATSTLEITGNLVPPPVNPVANPLPATTTSTPVAEFSGLLTNAVAGTGEAQTVGLGAGLGLGLPGAVNVIHSDVTASIGPDGAVAFNLPLIPLEAALGGDVVSVTASLADGQPLPAWLHFDTRNGQFAGLLPDDSNIATGSLEPDAAIPGQPRDPNVPAIVPQSITIEVIARDSKGNMSITDFTIDLSVRTPPKHGWNTVPGHNAFARWGMLQGATPVLSGEPISWHHGSAADIDRGGLVHAAEHVPAGRVGFSEQLKVHGLHALNADRAALLKNLQHFASR